MQNNLQVGHSSPLMQYVELCHIISGGFAHRGFDRCQNLVPMPPKKELKPEKDWLQQHLCDRVTPAQLLLKGTEVGAQLHQAPQQHKQGMGREARLKANISARSDNAAC